MPNRPYPLAVALSELGFALAAFACGLYDLPLWAAGLATFGMLSYWNWTRRDLINELRGMAWVRGAAGAFAVLIAIQAGSYWLGLGLGERFHEQAINSRIQCADLHCAADQSQQLAR